MKKFKELRKSAIQFEKPHFLHFTKMTNLTNDAEFTTKSTLSTAKAPAKAVGHMYQTCPKKCFIYHKIEKNAPMWFSRAYRSFHCQCVTVDIKHPVNCISLESLHCIDVIYANINVRIQKNYIGCHLKTIDLGHHTKHPNFFFWKRNRWKTNSELEVCKYNLS